MDNNKDFADVLVPVIMGVQETLSYVLYKNPIVTGTYDYVKNVAQAALPMISKKSEVAVPPVSVVIERTVTQLWPYGSGSSFVRLAGLFGASAVALGAYGAHAIYPKEGGDELKRIYETANRYHFFHSLALLAVPMCRFPKVSGSFLALGTVLFSGTCYYHAVTGNSQLRAVTPIGGTCLIVGWLTMML